MKMTPPSLSSEPAGTSALDARRPSSSSRSSVAVLYAISSGVEALRVFPFGVFLPKIKRRSRENLSHSRRALRRHCLPQGERVGSLL
jgi:hypothetical protein